MELSVQGAQVRRAGGHSPEKERRELQRESTLGTCRGSLRVLSRVGIYTRPRQESPERTGANSADTHTGQVVMPAPTRQTGKSHDTWSTGESTWEGFALDFTKINSFSSLKDC